ncbi:oligosaccharide flippase family protein [Desulfosporosinus sp. OT]|uniref:oligosaccharide flippase family protein n=1 Tax=Desulfosporosinus sp. OT TaxID=913865 RepID=UPI000223A56F|nr:oligosaccharide flippase family protein [Desulfosporosinus sp. OT]EGW41269.1 polysaccharide biosynthesis family protein [Desulfosporosinus sp. OT]
MKVNQLKAGALLSYASIFITIIIGLLYTPIMLRLLGQSEFGLYSLIGAVVGYLSILDLGLGNTIIRYTARNRALGDKDAESNMNGMFLILYCFIGLLTVILGVVLYSNIDNMFGATLAAAELKKAKIMMMLLIFNFAVSFPLGVFGSIMQAHERFVFVKLVAIIRSLMTPCIILPLLYLGYSSVSMVVVNTVLNIGCLLINLVYCFRVLKTTIYFKKFDLILLKEIAGYSFFIFLGVIVDKVYWSTGQFILGIVSGTVLVAIFAVAMQLTTMYIMFSTSVSSVLLPRITMMVANNASNDDLSHIMIKIGRVQYAIMAYILSGFILFGQAFIILWAGLNYSDAYYMVLLVMIPITIPLIQNVGIAILQAQNRNAFRSIVYLCIAVLNVLTSIPLAKMWGGFGCALATGVSLIVGNVIIINIYYHRWIGLNIPLFWINIGKMSLPMLISLLCGYGINLFIIQDSFLLLVVKIVLFSLIYICLMWQVGLDSYEKKLFLSPVKKVLNKCQVFNKDRCL